MRQAFEAATKVYETVKKSVREKWEAFKNKFEGTKTEIAQEVLKAESPEDLIATGKKLQEQGEALKLEQESIKREEVGEEKLEGDKNAIIENAHEEALIENEKFDETKVVEKAEAERVAAEEQAAHEEYVKQTEANEQAKIAELREKLGQGMEQSNLINPEQAEKISEVRNVFMQLFDKAGWTSFSELMAKSENILDGLDNDEQEQLAKEFFDETIGKNILNIPKSYQVYREFKGTAFAKKYAELEDARLKRAGYAGFTL